MPVEAQMTNLHVITKGDVLVVDSRLIATELGIDHKNLLATIRKYLTEIEKFGQVLFETETVTNSVGAVNQVSFCYLNENQTTFVMTLSRNTEKVIKCKQNLVDAFSIAKTLLSTPQPKSLPNSIEYVKAIKDLETIADSKLKRLIEFAMISELETVNVNNRALTGTTDQKHYVPVNVRASQLGYSTKQINTATRLGKFVKSLVTPAFQDWQGQYLVWHYELNNELDNAINQYFLN
jgi:phage regulator Rha-like protein